MTTTATTPCLLDAALDALAGGCSLLPVHHENKRPLARCLPLDAQGKATWEPFQSAPPTQRDVHRWVSAGARAIGVVCGRVSGGLVILDFDDGRFYRAWQPAVGDLAEGLPVQRTPSGGTHVVWRCAEPGGNLKLAWQRSDTASTGREVAIETRGEGGYAVIAPSEFADTAGYRMLNGSFGNIPTIPGARADALLAAARKLDEAPFTRQQLEKAERATEDTRYRASVNGQGSIIDAYNHANTIEETLKRYGYTPGPRGMFARPGRESYITSVTVRDGRSFHHSTNDLLHDGYWHRPFDVFCQYEYGGDCRTAVKDAAARLGLSGTRSQKHKAPPSGMADGPTAKYVLVPSTHVTAQGEHIERGAHEFTDAVLDALPPDTIYRRGTVPGQTTGEPGERAFDELTTDAARLLIDACMKLGQWRSVGVGDSQRQALSYRPCSRDNGNLVLSRASTDARVPALRHLTAYPIYLPGFRLCRTGFHDGVYYDEPPELRGIQPEMDAEVIRQTLDDLLIDFPFRDEASRQNIIGLLLTPLIRPAIDGNVPGTLIHAPLERTGKTKLAEEVFGGTVTGRRTPAMQISDNTEMDKRVLAMLLRGGTILHLDNLHEFLDLPCLASLLTATTYQGRQLGASKILELPNNLTLVATGNNVKATGELAKRMVPVLLQPRSDAPELRTDFHHADLWAYVRQQRPLVLSCLLGMIQRWIEAGKPRGQKPMGGFDVWAATVGGIMTLHGDEEWLSNAATWRDEADARRGDLRALVEAWARLYGTNPVKVKEVADLVLANDLFDEVTAGKDGRGLLTAIGMKVLNRNIDTPVGTYQIKKNSASRPALYSLKPLAAQEAA